MRWMPLWTLAAVGVVTALVLATAAALFLAFLERAAMHRDADQARRWLDEGLDSRADRRGRRRSREEPSRRRRRRSGAEAPPRRGPITIRPVPLSAASRDEYVRRWRYLLSRFVEQPRITTADTHDLARKLLAERDYPVEELDRDDVTVPDEFQVVAENYRIAHRVSSGVRTARTEQLRRAMLHLRVVLEELLADPPYDARIKPRKLTPREREDEQLRERERAVPAPNVDRYRVVVTDEGPQPPSEDDLHSPT
jgi:hypothetical protein